MKFKKAGAIVFFAFAVVFIVLGLFVMFYNPSPVRVSEKIEIASYYQTTDGSRYELRGKLKNVSDQTVHIPKHFGIETFVACDDGMGGPIGTGSYWWNAVAEDGIYLAPGEEFDLATVGSQSSGARYNLSGISSVRVTVDGYTYTVQGSSVSLLGIIVIVIGGIFLLGGVAMLAINLCAYKRYRLIVAKLYDMGMGDSLYLFGTYGEKGAQAKAAAKTAGTMAIGVISAALFGFGFYKVYSGAKRLEFILGSNGIYYGNCKVKQFSLESMNFLPGFELVQFAVGGGKNTVTLTRGEEQFVLFLKNSGCAKQAVLEKLENMKQGASVADLPMTDPFRL